MDRTPVSSSNVASIGYDPDQMILEVEFNNGAVYNYIDVPTQIFTDFLNAASKGKFMWANIRDVFVYERIE